MAKESHDLLPGTILHEAIIGAFWARGLGFDAWCEENGITPSNARNATFGQSRGPKGRQMLERIIDAAGRDFVERAYDERLKRIADARGLTGGRAA